MIFCHPAYLDCGSPIAIISFLLLLASLRPKEGEKKGFSEVCATRNARSNPSIARRVLDPPAAPSVAPPPVSALFSELTPRELDALRLIAQCLHNRDIAERLVISEKTVQNHISNIFAKLQINDRSQAIIRALQGGLLG